MTGIGLGIRRRATRLTCVCGWWSTGHSELSLLRNDTTGLRLIRAGREASLAVVVSRLGVWELSLLGQPLAGISRGRERARCNAPALLLFSGCCLYPMAVEQVALVRTNVARALLKRSAPACLWSREWLLEILTHGSFSVGELVIQRGEERARIQDEDAIALLTMDSAA